MPLRTNWILLYGRWLYDVLCSSTSTLQVTIVVRLWDGVPLVYIMVYTASGKWLVYIDAQIDIFSYSAVKWKYFGYLIYRYFKHMYVCSNFDKCLLRFQTSKVKTLFMSWLVTIHIYFFMVKVQSCIYNSEWYVNILMLNLASNFQDSIVYLNNKLITCEKYSSGMNSLHVKSA